MDELIRIGLLILGGAFSGLINVIAGAGSLVTLPILIGLGLSPGIANGTNRVTVIMQDISATFKFFKQKKLPLREGLLLSIPTIIGGTIGALFATKLTDQLLNVIISILLILMIIYIIWEPLKWGPSTQNQTTRLDLITVFVFFMIGLYAGFIQAAATYLWFAALLWRLKVDIVTADAIKVFLNLILTPITLIIFIYHHQIQVIDGLILGAGGFIGGWFGAKAAIKWSPKFIRMLMIIILSLSAVYMLIFNILHLL